MVPCPPSPPCNKTLSSVFGPCDQANRTSREVVPQCMNDDEVIEHLLNNGYNRRELPGGGNVQVSVEVGYWG